MDIRQIVREYLKKHSFDGLYNYCCVDKSSPPENSDAWDKWADVRYVYGEGICKDIIIKKLKQICKTHSLELVWEEQREIIHWEKADGN